MALTERQKREKEYYDQYATSFDLNNQIDFSPIDSVLQGRESRPWNSYWAIYQKAIEYYQTSPNDNPTLLDFGTGPGDNALRFQRIGYQIRGFDISENNIEVARQLFLKHGIEQAGEFTVSQAESLPYADESIDIIIGVDILHHVDISASIQECKRILKRGGQAIFREPIEVSFWDKIRNMKLVTTFFPNQVSFENHITEDERKLNVHDLKVISEHFPNITIERFVLFSRFDKLFRKNNDPSPSFLEKLDYYLMKVFPGFKNLGGGAIIILKK